jgi:hypothetical protein
LNSLAQGCCALAPGEVLVPCGGILAPDHDGLFPDFAADVRASFDEAEPMVEKRATRKWGRTGGEARRLKSCLMYVHLHVRKARKKN